ncbi:collagen alpha-3(VI) chain-like [Esox lucius]|nr:collagen alpha-3(VI) chain-like [Esox lucius]
MRDFVQTFVEKLKVEENRDRVSLVQYSTEPEAHFYLNTYTTKKPIVDSVRSLRHKGGRLLNTGAALQYVKDNIFSPSSGSRRQDGVPQILILFSGGKSNDEYSDTAEVNFKLDTHSTKDEIIDAVKGGRPLNTGEALDYVKNYVFTSTSGSRLVEGIPQILILLSGGKSEDDVLVPSQRLKAAGIVIFTVGVKDADEAEMQSIAHSPNQAFMLREFSDLSPVKQQLLSAVISHKDTVRPGLVQGSSVKRDIVFLLDGSDDVRSKFTAICDFVAKFVESFDVDQGKDQVAVVQYSNTAVMNFNLNTYKTGDDVVKAVRNLRPKGGRPQYTGTALQFLKQWQVTEI